MYKFTREKEWEKVEDIKNPFLKCVNDDWEIQLEELGYYDNATIELNNNIFTPNSNEFSLAVFQSNPSTDINPEYEFYCHITMGDIGYEVVIPSFPDLMAFYKDIFPIFKIHKDINEVN